MYKRANGRTLAALIASIVLLVSTFTSTAYANVGPPASVKDGDAVFFLPVKHDFIEVVSENLTYDIQTLGKEEAHAEIVATYHMRNTYQENVSTLAAFVANNPATEVQVCVDGNRVQLLRSETVPWNITGQDGYVEDLLARSWYNVGSWTVYGAGAPTFEEILRYAGTGERTGDTNAGYDFEMSLFELDFPAGGTRTLEVTYTENAAIIKQRKGYSYINPTAEFYYFLEPARYWKSFADLTVTINVPSHITIETSLPGFQRKDNSYSAHFHELPGENLRILAALDPTTFADTAKSAIPWALAGAALILFLLRRGKKAFS